MRFNKNRWQDESQELWPILPFQVIKAGTDWYDLANDLFNQQGTRKVSYIDDTGQRWSMELVMYKHPTGAADLTIGTLTTATDGTVTYTPTYEGRLIAETGVLVPTAGAPQWGGEIAGMLFSDYYTHFDDSYGSLENGRVVTIEEGDILMVVRNGEVELDTSSPVNDGDPLVSSGAVAGEVQPALAIDTTTTITLNTTLQQHLQGRKFYCVGHALETTGGAGLAYSFLDLPKRLPVS